MLSFFQIDKHFVDTHFALYVDARASEASLTVTYKRRIVAQHTFPITQYAKPCFSDEARWLDLRKPDDAQAFLNRDAGEYGSWIEDMQWRGHQGFFDQAA
jgi:hypothetical protein